jgi:hypothetical protein
MPIDIEIATWEQVTALPPGALQWLTTGERGMSSEAIFVALTGLHVGSHAGWTPADPHDVRRCRLLLAAVPAFEARFAEMANVNRHWALLVEHWEQLCALIDSTADDRGWSEPAIQSAAIELEAQHRRRRALTRSHELSCACDGDIDNCPEVIGWGAYLDKQHERRWAGVEEAK